MKRRTHRVCTVAVLAMLASTIVRVLPCPDAALTRRLRSVRPSTGSAADAAMATSSVIVDSAWRAFLTEEITTGAFPAGLTVLFVGGTVARRIGPMIVRERSASRAHPRRIGNHCSTAHRRNCAGLPAHLRSPIGSARDHGRLRMRSEPWPRGVTLATPRSKGKIVPSRARPATGRSGSPLEYPSTRPACGTVLRRRRHAAVAHEPGLNSDVTWHRAVRAAHGEV